MTGLRIVDGSGADWPITGHRCLVCRMPLDPAVDDSIHPTCRPAQPISDQAEAQLIAHLATKLGGRRDVVHINHEGEICMTDPRSANRRRHHEH